jgi:tRNA modification GTPase
VFSPSDTIVAIATPPGRGGIGVVRLSGPEARRIARCLLTHSTDLEPRRATLTRFRLPPPRVDSPQALAAKSGSEAPPAPSERSACSAEAAAVAGATKTGRAVAIDHVVATYFPAPQSYTRDDVVELSAHGSPVVLRSIVAAAMSSGARLAEPGEFTLRAFLNGRIDLTQAEAVADLIDSVTPLQARAAFDQLQGTLTRTIGEIEAALFDLIAKLEASVDFPDEGYHFIEPVTLADAIDGLIARAASLLAQATRGRLVREGLQITIVGKPNVGKSSLFNALVGTARAIVAEVPGTTRDLLTEVVDLDGLRVTLVDAAGLRPTTDAVELEGVQRARQAQAVSDLILVVLDGAKPLDETDQQILAQTLEMRRVVVSNKADLESRWAEPYGLRISAKTRLGIPELRELLVKALDVEPLRDTPDITNVRHVDLVQRAHDALVRARAAALSDTGSLSEEFVLVDLQEARSAFEEISGRKTPDDVLEHIFSRFCIGK